MLMLNSRSNEHDNNEINIITNNVKIVQLRVIVTGSEGPCSQSQVKILLVVVRFQRRQGCRACQELEVAAAGF